MLVSKAIYGLKLQVLNIVNTLQIFYFKGDGFKAEPILTYGC